MRGLGRRRRGGDDGRGAVSVFGEEIPCSARDHDDPSDQGQEARSFFRLGGLRFGHRFRLGGDANLQRIDPDRSFDVLELRRAEIGDRHIEPAAHLPIGVLGQADRAGLGDALQARGDVDAVAHQVAVGLLDDVAEMNADAKLNALSGGTPALRSTMRVLHLDGAAHRVDDAAKLDERCRRPCA